MANASTADGAYVNQYHCTTGTNQQWRFQDMGSGYYRLVAVVQWPCGSGTNQQFQRPAV